MIFFTTKYISTKRRIFNTVEFKHVSNQSSKKVIKPWKQYAFPAKSQFPKKSKKKLVKIVSNSLNDLSSIDIQELAQLLKINMSSAQEADLAQINRNIEIADEIFIRDKESFFALKSKLILVLIKEFKFDQLVEDYEINSLLEQLVQFNMAFGSISPQEVSLHVHQSIQRDRLTESLNNLSLEIYNYELMSKISEDHFDVNSSLEAKINQKIKEVDDILIQIDNLDNDFYKSIGESNLDFVNEYLEIPFYRLLAASSYDTLRDQALIFIKNFSDSILGYFFLFKAYEGLGEKELALEVITNSQLTDLEKEHLQNRINQSHGENPKYFWKGLSL